MDDKAHRPAEPDQDSGDRDERLHVLAELAARPLDERVSERMRRALKGVGSGRPVRRALHRLTSSSASGAVFGPFPMPAAAAEASIGMGR